MQMTELEYPNCFLVQGTQRDVRAWVQRRRLLPEGVLDRLPVGPFVNHDVDETGRGQPRSPAIDAATTSPGDNRSDAVTSATATHGSRLDDNRSAGKPRCRCTITSLAGESSMLAYHRSKSAPDGADPTP